MMLRTTYLGRAQTHKAYLRDCRRRQARPGSAAGGGALLAIVDGGVPGAAVSGWRSPRVPCSPGTPPRPTEPRRRLHQRRLGRLRLRPCTQGVPRPPQRGITLRHPETRTPQNSQCRKTSLWEMRATEMVQSYYALGLCSKQKCILWRKLWP